MTKGNGRFKKGEIAPGSVLIDEAVAREYQRRSVAKRKENKTLRAAMREALLEVSPTTGMTRMEHIVRRALQNHEKGKLSFSDLKQLASVLGEDVLKIEQDGPAVVVVPENAMKAIDKWKARKDK